MGRFDPPQSFYDPPEPPEPCCALAEDDEYHDTEACMADQAEEAAEARWERFRDRQRDWDWDAA